MDAENLAQAAPIREKINPSNTLIGRFLERESGEIKKWPLTMPKYALVVLPLFSGKRFFSAPAIIIMFIFRTYVVSKSNIRGYFPPISLLLL